MQWKQWGIFFDTIHTREEFQRFLEDFLGAKYDSACFIIKPNWINAEYGHFTDPQILDWLLSCLPTRAKKIVVEAYSARNDPNIGNDSTPDALPSLTLEVLRQTEKEFLVKTGIAESLKQNRAEYMNIDEELCAGRAASPDLTRSKVEGCYPPVVRQELYEYIPQRLYDLREEAILISFAKLKRLSLCLKNIFGLIPGHYAGSRGRYHGDNDSELDQSILDVNKVYNALFDVVGIIEGVNTACVIHPNGKYHSMFGYRYHTLDALGLVFGGHNTTLLDIFVCQYLNRAPTTQKYLKMASKILTTWDATIIESAKNAQKPAVIASLSP
ncbi:MAG: hypothetical protein ACE5R6_02960 [Candidatus Heimdallarchaeota archaeon]